MPVAEIAVTLGGVAVIAFLAWFFFGPRREGFLFSFLYQCPGDGSDKRASS